MPGRLNSFQKTMLQWDDWHPYNAVHVVQIPGTLNKNQLQQAIRTAIETRGLTNLTLNLRKSTYYYEPCTSSSDLTVLTEAEDPRPALEAEMERQLNMPFDRSGRFNPFRFFVAPSNSFFLLGLTYFHAAADAEAIVLLIRDLVRAYEAKVAPAALPSLELYPDGGNQLLLKHPKVLISKLLTLPSHIRKMRHSHRLRYRHAAEMKNAFKLFSLGPKSLQALMAASRSWGVTINDLLMALLMKSLSPLAADRRKQKKRRQITLGCIVNIRRDLQAGTERGFGLFLGSFTVTHEVPEGISLNDLARDIARQTLAIKQQKLYLGTPLELGFARFMLSFFRPERKQTFYQKNYPLWGGITNMNLNSLWTQPGETAPLDYFRGVSTGPATPLVLSVTSVGDRMNVGLSYRATLFSPQDIDQLVKHFVDQVEHG